MAVRVLVIEDNPINRELMDYMLRAYGFETLKAVDGLIGLDVARRERPDLILCDIQMPQMDGFEFARQAKQDALLANTPLVAVTALAMVGDRDRILAAGFDGYIAKPVEPAQFLADLQRFLPLQTPPGAAAGAAAQSEPRALLATVLVLDDTPINLAYKRSLLEPLGCRVLSAEEPDEAFALALQHRPQLILSDIDLRQGTGLDFMRRVKADARLCNTPFLFVSASRWDDALREEAMRLGASDYLHRPVEPQRLIAAVAAALEPRKG